MGDTRRPQLDAGRALQQMELVAWSEGLGTCFVGMRAEEQQKEVKTLLGIPDDMDLITVLPFGYRVEGARGRGTPRKPMSEIVYGERFGESLALEYGLGQAETSPGAGRRLYGETILHLGCGRQH